MKRHSLICLLLAIALSAGLVGCSGKPTQSGSSDAGPSSTAVTAGGQSDSTTTESGATGESGAVGGDETNGTRPPTKGNTKSTAKTTKPIISTPTVPVISDHITTNMKEKVENLGGYTCVIKTPWKSMWIGSPSDKTTTPAVKKFKEIVAAVEKAYNCKIKIEQEDEDIRYPIIKAAVAGDKYADIVQTGPGSFYEVAVAGLMEPISGSTILDVNDPVWIPSTKQFASYDGKVYGGMWITDNFETPLPKTMFFNKTLLNKYAKGTNIYQLVKNKQWTWSKFKEISKAVYNKSNKAVMGITAYDINSLAFGWIASNDGYLAQANGNKLVYKGNSENTIEAMESIRSLATEQIWRDPAGGDWLKTSLADFMSGKTLFFVHDYYTAPNHLQSEMKDDYGTIPFPMGPKATEYIGYYYNANFFAFPADNKDFDKAQKVMKALLIRSYIQDWKTKEEKTALRDGESADMLEIMLKNARIDIALNVPSFSNIVSPKMLEIARGTTTAAKGMGEVAQSAQNQLNEFFK